MADPAMPGGTAPDPAAQAAGAQAGDTPGIVAPPPLIFLAVVLGGWLIGFVLGPDGPLPSLPSRPWAWLGAILAALALALGAASRVALRQAGTPINPYKPSTALVRAGPYRFSRNPVYVALAVLTIGLALLVGSLWILVLLVPALVLMQLGVIAREEAYLSRTFGDQYRHYSAEVRRWL
jgi:protein-S-isoprenylcysteine O-methyltransferase Ste14